MKRRNGECGKLRRPIKRNKITDGIYGSTILYLKFFILWALVLLADFILEFRFEFLWPFWLLLRSVYDSYKYQGLAFSVFFVSIALTSDMICYFFIPVQWLFFAASTYVWVQYVWHTEKGICLPTVILWLLFAYTEAAIRLKDLRHMPFHLDLCRPFAAHCIGYPVVTLGFGFKSYVTFRIRQRKQKDVRKENNFYMSLLSQALPIEAVQQQNAQTTSLDKTKGEIESNGIVNHNGIVLKSSSHRKSLDKGEKTNETSISNGTTHNHSSHHNHLEFTLKSQSTIEGDDEVSEKDRRGKNHKTNNNNNNNNTNSNNTNSSNLTCSSASDKRDTYKKSKQTQKQSDNNIHTRSNMCSDSHTAHENLQPPLYKDEYCLKLEADIKKLKSELNSSRQGEQELRSQINSLISSEKQFRSEISSLLHHNDELQTKVQNLGALRQGERQTSERKLADERRARCVLEQQLSSERKAKQRAEEAASRANAAAAAAVASKPECTESCRSRRRELESEMKQLRRELKLREERCANTDRELQTMLQYKDSHNEAEMLLAALNALRDKTSHLEDSLSAETRIKLDLFSALGEAKRQLEIKDSLIRAHEKEVAELKGKMAQVLAVMPVEFVSAAGGVVGGGGGVTSPLDPNASVYTPKQQSSGHLTSEA